MNLKETLAQKKSELTELEPLIKENDVEAIDKGEVLVKEISDLESQIEKAEKAASILDSIGKTDETNKDITEGKKMSTIEEFTSKCAEMTDKKSGVRTHFEKAYNSVITAPTIADVDRSIAPVGGRTPAASLFTEAQISGNAITYFLEGAFETYNNAGISTTSQNGKKPQVSTSFSATTLALSKIAAWEAG